MNRTVITVAAAGVLLTGCGSVAAGNQQAGHKPAAAPSSSPAPARHSPATITYVVTGSPADVTYGPAGSNSTGSVPMHLTRPLRSPVYYSVTAQLQGGGSVRCAIKVSGKAISHASASGGYNIASCEISQDPLTGRWQDTNGGAA